MKAFCNSKLKPELNFAWLKRQHANYWFPQLHINASLIFQIMVSRTVVISLIISGPIAGNPGPSQNPVRQPAVVAPQTPAQVPVQAPPLPVTQPVYQPQNQARSFYYVCIF